VFLSAVIEERGLDMKTLSLQIGRNETYIQQYLNRGTPRTLKENDRARLAEILGVDEVSLGGRLRSGESRVDVAPLKPATLGSVTGRRGIPEDAIAEMALTAGLGDGQMSIVTSEFDASGHSYAAEEVRDWWRLPDWLLRSQFNAKAANVACFPAQGDSMAPTIKNGDVVFVDLRHRVPSPPGLYALADAFGGVEVKRLEVVSANGQEPIRVLVQSDNPRHSPRERLLDEIALVGRVVGRFTTD
jgi:hypothetical protein